MTNITIRSAEVADAARLNAALRELSNDLNDTHLASNKDVELAGFGKSRSFSALLAELQSEVVGVVMFSPLYSTTRGAPGVFVSDLWVSKSQRGAGIARNLLAAVCESAADKWGAAFLRLNVYRHNHIAIAAYEKIGFDTDLHEAVMTLNLDEFNTLRAKKWRQFTTIVNALGLDASENDPLKGLAITTSGFGRIGKAIAEIGLPALLVQEGGYLSDELSKILTSFINGFDVV